MLEVIKSIDDNDFKYMHWNFKWKKIILIILITRYDFKYDNLTYNLNLIFKLVIVEYSTLRFNFSLVIKSLISTNNISDR